LIATWRIYSVDNRGRLVSNRQFQQPTIDEEAVREGQWISWVQGAFYDPIESTNYAYILNPHYALFANYLQTTKVYVCPADKEQVTIGPDPGPRIRSCAMSGYMGWEGPADTRCISGAYRTFNKDSDIPAAMMPSGAFVFIDVNEKSICWPYFGVKMDTEAFFNWPSSIHNRGGVVSFADGHIEYDRWVDPRTVNAYSGNYHNHDYSSPRNADLTWLQQRSTVRK